MRLRTGLAIALLGLAGCSASDHSAPAAPQASPGSKVFIADAANLAIGSLIDPNPAPGVVTPDRIVAGPDTGLGAPGGTPSVSSLPSIALDAAGDRLYVATQSSALVFDRIGTASGNVPRSRAIQSSVSNHAVNFFGLHITAGDVLYAVEPTGEVRAFNNASTLDGAVAPDRTITPNVVAPITASFGVTFDAANNALYVGVASPSSSILVFNNATTANATLPPNRTLNFALAVGSFCLDEGRDILYASLETGVILVFDNASTLGMGTPVPPLPPPNRLMTLSPSRPIQLYISVDTVNNRLYAVNGTTVFIVNGASVADDAMLGATRLTLSSSSSLLSAVAVAP